MAARLITLLTCWLGLAAPASADVCEIRVVLSDTADQVTVGGELAWMSGDKGIGTSSQAVEVKLVDGGVKVVWHFGQTSESSSLLVKIPEQELTIVVLGNSDDVDKLVVGAHRSIAVRAHIHSPDRVSIGLVSKPCCAAVGDSRVAPSDRSPATFRESAQTDNCGSAPMGVARCHLAGLEIRDFHHEGIDTDRLASQGIPPVLDLEDPSWEAWADNGSEGRTGAVSHNQPPILSGELRRSMVNY